MYSSLHPVEWIAAEGLAYEQYPHVNDKTVSMSVTTRDAMTAINVNNHRVEMQVTPGEEFRNKPCEIRQHAGDIVYVPRHWSHQVVNLAETVGFAVEIEDYIY